MVTDLWAERPLFDAEHADFRAAVRRFALEHIKENVPKWEAEQAIPRSVWERAGELGLFEGGLAPDGEKPPDYRFRCVAIEELARVGASSLAAGFGVHADVTLPYIADLATRSQLARWWEDSLSGRKIGALAMTEPGAGSDLRGITTHAARDGSGWVLSGAKTFISNGAEADFVVVLARTSDRRARDEYSLFVVEDGMSGFTRGRRLHKLGLQAQDTSELWFDGVRLGPDNVLGEAGDGMRYVIEHLPLERLSIAMTACAGARVALAWTLEYTRSREAFGRPIAAFQNTQFVMAELVTELEVAQAFVDDAVLRFNAGTLDAVHAAKAKWWCTEMHKRVVDSCLQLFGGYGYMWESPIARAYVDTRVTTIYGGTTEIMKHIIAKDLYGSVPVAQ